MATQNIKFKGLRRTPSEETAKDGDLCESVNVVSTNGEIKILEQPQPVKNQFGGEIRINGTLIGVHNGIWGIHYIGVKSDKKTVFFTDSEGNPIECSDGVQQVTLSSEVVDVDCVGNTVIISCKASEDGGGLYYFLWRDSKYAYLGDTIPYPVLRFELVEDDDSLVEKSTPEMYCKDESGNKYRGMCCGTGNLTNYRVSFPNNLKFDGDDGSVYFKWDTNRPILNKNIGMKVESAIHDELEKGYFVFPFFVRYAVRLYDGSYIDHSSPLLMLPSTGKSPILVVLKFLRTWFVDRVIGWDTRLDFINPIIKMYGYKLRYCIDTNADYSLWGDVVKGVDIFCSSQIRSYDAVNFTDYYDTSYEGWDTYFSNKENNFSGYPISVDSWSHIFKHYSELDSDFLGYEFLPDERRNKKDSINYQEPIYTYTGVPESIYLTPSVSEEKMIHKLSDNSVFYKLKELSIEELGEGDKVIELDAGYLNNLETKETLPDDYHSHCSLSGEVLHQYNRRLIVSGISEKAWGGYPYESHKASNFKLEYVLEKNGREIVVGSDTGRYMVNAVGIPYLYYPDADCKYANFGTYANGAWSYYKIPMIAHPNLNGAYYFAHFDSIFNRAVNYADRITPTSWMAFSTNAWYEVLASIYMSPVSNPFIFPVDNARVIGNRRITEIAVNTQAMSSGQFGQYPLYVFTEDGVWSITITGEGLMGVASPVSSDVTTESDDLGCPTVIRSKQGIFFLSRQGLMHINGTKIECISSVLDGKPFNVKTMLLPASSVMPIESSNPTYANFISLINTVSDSVSFRGYVSRGAFLAYDYSHERILVMNNAKDYCYVYDIPNAAWTRMVVMGKSNGSRSSSTRTFKASFNNYTQTYIQDSNGYLMDIISNLDENRTNVAEAEKYGFLASRPLRLETDQFKTINRMLHRTSIYGGRCYQKMALYGTRDGINYVNVKCLRGASFRSYIVVLYLRMMPTDRYSYLTMQFEPRFPDKIR